MTVTERTPFHAALPESSRPVERFDGAVWRELETPTATITVTSVGSTVLASESVLTLLRDYCDDAHNGRYSPSDTRQYLAEGGNARVYQVGDSPFVVKEKKRGSPENLLPALDRIDRIADAVERNCPRWIAVPRHYAVVVPKQDPASQFMLMEKVDSGITVGDILAAGMEPRETQLEADMNDIYGDITEATKESVLAQFMKYKELVRLALITEGLVPEKYLTDFNNKYNAMLEPLTTPVVGSRYRMSVIDQ